MVEACNFIKKETLTQVFSCEFLEITKNTFSYRTPPVAASASFSRVSDLIYRKSKTNCIFKLLFSRNSFEVFRISFFSEFRVKFVVTATQLKKYENKRQPKTKIFLPPKTHVE